VAAISVPISLVSSVFTPFSGIPVLGICTGIVSSLLGLYALFLQVTAVKAVNKFGWGQAAGSVLLPGLVFFCCALVIFGILLSMGVAIGETFESINQSLP
jgi:Na+-transporting NADH:ubiquinone oxidoreductase subunit NqrD